MTDKKPWASVVTVTIDPTIPAFAGYAAGSMTRGEPFMCINLPAFIGVREAHNFTDEEMAHFMAETIVHECFHAVEEFCGLAFSEERVEGWIDALVPKMAEMGMEQADEEPDPITLALAEIERLRKALEHVAAKLDRILDEGGHLDSDDLRFVQAALTPPAKEQTSRSAPDKSEGGAE